MLRHSPDPVIDSSGNSFTVLLSQWVVSRAEVISSLQCWLIRSAVTRRDRISSSCSVGSAWQFQVFPLCWASLRDKGGISSETDRQWQHQQTAWYRYQTESLTKYKHIICGPRQRRKKEKALAHMPFFFCFYLLLSETGLKEINYNKGNEFNFRSSQGMQSKDTRVHAHTSELKTANWNVNPPKRLIGTKINTCCSTLCRGAHMCVCACVCERKRVGHGGWGLSILPHNKQFVSQEHPSCSCCWLHRRSLGNVLASIVPEVRGHRMLLKAQKGSWEVG